MVFDDKCIILQLGWEQREPLVNTHRHVSVWHAAHAHDLRPPPLLTVATSATWATWARTSPTLSTVWCPWQQPRRVLAWPSSAPMPFDECLRQVDRQVRRVRRVRMGDGGAGGW